MAEGVGFEPTELLHSTVFKTAAFNHSAIPPWFKRMKLSPRKSQVNIFIGPLMLFEHPINTKRTLWRACMEEQDVRFILAKKPGATHPDTSSTIKHWSAFVFSAYSRKFGPPAARVIVESSVF